MQRKTRKLFHLIITHFPISIQNTILHLSKEGNWNNTTCLENIKKHQESDISMYVYLHYIYRHMHIYKTYVHMYR